MRKKKPDRQDRERKKRRKLYTNRDRDKHRFCPDKTSCLHCTFRFVREEVSIFVYCFAQERLNMTEGNCKVKIILSRLDREN